jgi:ArsR family transcriptional regulator
LPSIDRRTSSSAPRRWRGRRKVSNIAWKHGALDRLPIKNASVDVAVLSQALHHAPKPDVALAEARRILRPGGTLLVLDLRQHSEHWVKGTLGDQWLGFKDEQLKSLIAAAGFTEIAVRVGARRAGDPFTVLIASGKAPAKERVHRS